MFSTEFCDYWWVRNASTSEWPSAWDGETCCTGDGVGGGVRMLRCIRRLLGEVFWALGEGFGLHPWVRFDISEADIQDEKGIELWLPNV